MAKFVKLKMQTVPTRRQVKRVGLAALTLNRMALNRAALGQPNFPLGIFSFLLGALIIFSLSIQENRAVRHLNVLLLDLTTPIVDAVTQPFTSLSSYQDIFRTEESLRTEVVALRETNERYLTLIQSLRQKTLDHQELQKLANVVPDPKVERISARVVGRVSDGMNSTLTIRAGAHEGLVKDQPVVTADGVVGRISEVGGMSSTSARVMPITDFSSRIPVEIGETQEHGVIAGQNSADLHLIHLEKSTKVKVKVGDRLMTSGYGGIFPRGLPVAIVTSVTSDKITARPIVAHTPSFVTVLLGS